MAHWNMHTDIPWDRFDPSKADPAFVRIVKAASLVEFNAADYVSYLKQVFPGDAQFQADAEVWGDEETQHGNSLRKWAELADPTFNFDASFKRFTEGYQQVPKEVSASVRGSRTGELIARCIVEMGTSNYYTAIKEATNEPALKILAGKIAADELRHYKLFYDALQRYRKEEGLGLLARLKVALKRVIESSDDELAYAYFAANAAPDEVYNRKTYSRLYARYAYSLYHRRHIDMMAAQLFKAVGLKPHTRLYRAVTALGWRLVRWQQRSLQTAA